MNSKPSTLLTLSVLNLVAFVVTIVFNVLSTTLPLNERTAQEISDALPSYFTPAGYTFFIWGVIYLALLGFTVYQALPGQRQQSLLGRVGLLFVLSSLANVGWLLAWHYGAFALSVVFMVSLLVTLIVLYLRLRIGHPDPSLTAAQRLFVHLPFSLYLGWITVATIANIASVSGYYGFDGFGLPGQLWSAIMMGVAAIVAGLLLWNRRNLAYAAVLVWALSGIRGAYPDEPLLATVAPVAALLIALFAIAGYVRTRHARAAADRYVPAAS